MSEVKGGLYKRLYPGEELGLKDSPYIIKNEGTETARVHIYKQKPSLEQAVDTQDNHGDDEQK